MQKKMGSKRLTVILLAIILLLCCTIGGTMALLKMTTPAITNVFTVGDVSITLSETTGTTNYKIVPGNTQVKDPKVTVSANSEDCWVFVKIEEVNNDTIKYFNWGIGTGWTALSGNTGVYYIEGTAGGEYPVLEEDKISYSEDLTKDDMNALYTENTTTIDPDKQPELKITAYAVQKANVADASTAWAEVAN